MRFDWRTRDTGEITGEWWCVGCGVRGGAWCVGCEARPGVAHLADALELRLRREAEVDEVARHRVVVLGVDVSDELDQRVPAQRGKV